MASSTIQNKISEAAKKLAGSFEQFKAAKQSIRALKKTLKDKLEMDFKYQELLKKEKALKASKKEITEELQEIKKTKEQIAMETDEQKEIDDFMEKEESKFLESKDTVIAELSSQLQQEGMLAEIQYKNGDLILIVARS